VLETERAEFVFGDLAIEEGPGPATEGLYFLTDEAIMFNFK
jgi:hypothetical protein